MPTQVLRAAIETHKEIQDCLVIVRGTELVQAEPVKVNKLLQTTLGTHWKAVKLVAQLF